MNTIEKDGKEYIAISQNGLRNTMRYVEDKPELKGLLDALFEDIKPKNVMKRIKTFKNAYDELGNNHPFVLAYNAWYHYGLAGQDDIDAYLKLRIICAALNEGWEPQFTNDEKRYYPYLVLYTKEEIENIDEVKKKELVLYNNFVLIPATVDYDFGSGSAGYVAHLAFKTRELANYCCKQFIDLWKDFYLAQK